MSRPLGFLGRCAGAVVLGCALTAGSVVTTLAGASAQSITEPACSGSESIVDGTPTCVPAPVAPGVSNVQPAPADTQQQDGGHH